MNIATYKLSLLVVSGLLVAGCATTQPYQFSSGEKNALLKKGAGISMCKDGKFYRLPPVDGESATPIPADGGRITLIAAMTYSGYNVTYSCYPSISFQPREGETYLVNSFVRGDKCYAELVREDLVQQTGVAFVPSIGPRDCFVQR